MTVADDHTVAAQAATDAALGSAFDADERRRFWLRVDHVMPLARDLLAALYPHVEHTDVLRDALEVVTAGFAKRPARLRALDAAREMEPHWFQRNTQIGYTAYADRFGGTLAGVGEHLHHLETLDVTYLHLMHVLRAREGDNDGGFAVIGYGEVEPALGTRHDLVALADELHGRGIALCLDLVMNHTAREHPWAQAARDGSARHRAYYLVLADRAEVDAYERFLPEVFPQIAPGNFTYDDALHAWVWTTFNSYQWDLDYRNPAVFLEILKVMLDLANLGVDVLRLDAVAFTWKRLGTNCQNQPEAHLLAQAFRALVGMAAPGVLLQAEAIVGPADLLGYLGVHHTQRAECQLAYHNQLMVNIWDALATGDARLASASLESLTLTPADTSWITYLRCHDDIGWAIDDRLAAAANVSGPAHRRHLAAFYRGDVLGSYAEGAAFSSNPAADDERTCGSAAALCGITRARAAGDQVALERAVRRLLLGFAIICGFGGIPLIYMGDEFALGNDHSYLTDPVLGDDSRWMHRPFMDWSAVDRAAENGTVEQRVFQGLQRIIGLRRAVPAMSAGGEIWIHRLQPVSVLAWVRRHPRHGRFYGLANFAEEPVSVPADVLDWAGLARPVEILGGGAVVRADRLELPPVAAAWFVDELDKGVQPRQGGAQ